jgi:thymidylate synthase
MSVQYRPYGLRRPDSQYQDRLALILHQGIPARSFHAVGSRTYMGLPPMRFDLRNGFPITTVRDLKGSWKSAIGEILAFINGVRTQDELVNEFQVNKRFWADTVTAEKCAKFGLQAGDLGDGSYGPGMGAYPAPDGTKTNQMRNVLEQIRRLPEVRTHWVDPWIPFYTMDGENAKRKVVVAPCHGWMHWRVINGGLHLQMHQRAADMPIGSVYNTLQYAALLIAAAHVLKMEARWFYHSFSDAHIYDNQFDPWVHDMIRREPLALPTLTLAEDAPDDLFQFRPRHFILSDYNPHPAMNDIPFSV